MKNFLRLILLVSLFIILSFRVIAQNEFYPAMTVVKKITASSYLIDKNQSKFAYHPVNLIDEDNNTAWFEGVKGDGKGEWVKFEFIVPVNIEQIHVINGYGKSTQLFKANNRVKNLEISDNKGNKVVVDLKDSLELQDIKFTTSQITSLCFKILDVYKGNTYNDTGLSEIKLNAYLNDTSKKEVDKEKVFTAFDKINFSEGGEVSSAGINKFFKDNGELLNSSLIKELFERKYPPLDGDGNDERLYSVLNGFKQYSQFIPAILKVVYDKSDNGFFVTENDNSDPYAITINNLLSNEIMIPSIKHSGKGYYESYYYILNAGDTRIVPSFLDELIKTKNVMYITELMPSELLIKQQDTYSKKVIKQYLAEKNMSQEVWKELEKALAGMK